MTPAQIAAARALCDAATPGPWGVVTGWDVETDWYTYDAVGPHRHEDDAEFVAQARTLLPAALDALEAAEAKLAALHASPPGAS